jgi:putative SOS response-associated peptidase YedK
MCGRFAFDAEISDLESRFAATALFAGNVRHYNVAPGMVMPIIIHKSPNTVIQARWGLIPFWSKDPRIGYNMINARADGIDTKPAFRKPFASQRCLVPTTGFFEWKHMGDEKIPYYIHLKDEKLFAFAGLYDEWLDSEGHPLVSFTIITTTPNTRMATIHDRMPVIFSKKEENTWLDPGCSDKEKLLSLLDPYDDTAMETYPVSSLINNPKHDSPDVLAPR